MTPIGYITKATKGKGNTMQPSSQSTKLNEAIMDFEAKLGRIVETDDHEAVQRWVEELRGSFGSLDALICTQRQRVHEKLFREIADQDTSELKHIRELKDADEQIEKILDCVKSQLIVFNVDSSSEVEARLEGQGSENEPLQDVVDRCTELIHWIREQEGSVTAWFAEAFANGAAASEALRKPTALIRKSRRSRLGRVERDKRGEMKS